jgi:hypothetical protein
MSNHMVTTELIDTKKNKKNWVTSYNCMHIIQLSYLISLILNCLTRKRRKRMRKLSNIGPKGAFWCTELGQGKQSG